MKDYYWEIETERLRLTSWQDTEEDAKGLYSWASNPNVGPNAGWKPHASLEESKKILREMFIPGGDGYAIREKDTGEIIGNISLYDDTAREGVRSMELGYALKEECWGKGYMTEAVKALISYFFEDRPWLRAIRIDVFDGNEASRSVARKCGFYYDSMSLNVLTNFGNVEDEEHYSLTVGDYEWAQRKSA